MEEQRRNANGNVLQQYDSRDRSLNGTAGDEYLSTDTSRSRSSWMTAESLISLPDRETQFNFVITGGSRSGQEAPAASSLMSFAEFVQYKFIPEYVGIRRSTGRAHFQAILKHVLPPEQVARLFEENPRNKKVKLKAVRGWPYMDSLALRDIDGERIQHLTSTALDAGYSVQTATHIRNVLRAIFSHAIRSYCYTGKNPATLVTLPAMVRKKAHILTLAQLKQVMLLMRHPEKDIALLALLTGMNVAETCGLQWEYVNLSNETRLVDGEWVPPKTIAVRKQCYRGEFGFVVGCRERFVSASELLCRVLRDLKKRERFTGPQDFVIASRNGTAINPENIAARRLKPIGKALEMPWLSWYVFCRTHIKLRSEFGHNLHKEYEQVIPL